jgi:hypothetical protein
VSEKAEPGKPSRKRLAAAPRHPVTPASIGQPLPPDCPVRPLGMLPGDVPTAVYLSGSGTIVKLTGQAHGAGNLSGLFAPHNRYLWDHWPRVTRGGDNVDGFRAERVREDLFHAAGKKGIWNDLDRVRGAGAWRDDAGRLVLHLGDRVLREWQVQRWGELDGYVYPASAPMLGPWNKADDGAAAAELLGLLRTWTWRHDAIAPLLLLGWIAASMIGGALTWRPQGWVTGDRGTGKSTLLEVVRGVLGPNASVATGNTTAAGIRQTLADKSLPVLLDELEAQDDSADTVHRVIELLRQASSGAIGLRGGAEHKATAFQIRSSMLAASILVPPLRSQDRSRIALLELLPRPATAGNVLPRSDALAQIGQRVLRRLVDQWQRLPEALERWRQQLGAHLQMDARGQDQYGTLLACGELALGDGFDGDELDDITRDLKKLLTEALADDVPDWRRCIDHLMTAAADTWRGGEKQTIGRLVAMAAKDFGEPDSVQSNRALAVYGVRVVLEKGVFMVAVANQHQGLAGAFQRTVWSARSGASGGWRQTLLRAPGAAARPVALRFEGHSAKVVQVPLSLAMGDE